MFASQGLLDMFAPCKLSLTCLLCLSPDHVDFQLKSKYAHTRIPASMSGPRPPILTVLFQLLILQQSHNSACGPSRQEA